MYIYSGDHYLPQYRNTFLSNTHIPGENTVQIASMQEYGATKTQCFHPPGVPSLLGILRQCVIRSLPDTFNTWPAVEIEPHISIPESNALPTQPHILIYIQSIKSSTFFMFSTQKNRKSWFRMLMLCKELIMAQNWLLKWLPHTIKLTAWDLQVDTIVCVFKNILLNWLDHISLALQFTELFQIHSIVQWSSWQSADLGIIWDRDLFSDTSWGECRTFGINKRPHRAVSCSIFYPRTYLEKPYIVILFLFTFNCTQTT